MGSHNDEFFSLWPNNVYILISPQPKKSNMAWIGTPAEDLAASAAPPAGGPAEALLAADVGTDESGADPVCARATVVVSQIALTAQSAIAEAATPLTDGGGDPGELNWKRGAARDRGAMAVCRQRQRGGRCSKTMRAGNRLLLAPFFFFFFFFFFFLFAFADEPTH